ncbi:MAG TPA: SGNH/GDSL hydrolase family protein [Acidimicrobiia bacterium]|jgi:hypothetical protein
MSVPGKIKSGMELGQLFDPRRPRRLFTIGDSHSAVMRFEPGVRVLHLGPVTMHRAGRPGELVRLIARSAAGPSLAPHTDRVAGAVVRALIRSDDTFTCFFGEIDVRAHFAQHCEEYGGATEQARALARRAAEATAALAAMTGARGAFASITPPSGHLHDADFPTSGSLEARREWTILLNRELEAASSALGLDFVDFHAAYTDAAGNLDRWRADDTVHVLPRYDDHIVAALRDHDLFPVQP